LTLATRTKPDGPVTWREGGEQPPSDPVDLDAYYNTRLDSAFWYDAQTHSWRPWAVEPTPPPAPPSMPRQLLEAYAWHLTPASIGASIAHTLTGLIVWAEVQRRLTYGWTRAPEDVVRVEYDGSTAWVTWHQTLLPSGGMYRLQAIIVGSSVFS